MSITKQQAALLFSYDFKLVDKEGNEYDIKSISRNGMYLTEEGNTDGMPYTHLPFENVGYEYSIKAYHHSCLTKEVFTQGLKINVLYELTRLYYPEIREWNISLIDVRSNYIKVLVDGGGFTNQEHKIPLHHDTMRGCEIDLILKLHFLPHGIEESNVKWINK